MNKAAILIVAGFHFNLTPIKEYGLYDKVWQEGGWLRAEETN